MSSRTLRVLRSMFFPDRCSFCGNIIPLDAGICSDCRQNEKPIEAPKCLACSKSKRDCTCNGKANFYQGITAPYNYKGKVRNGIIRWKYGTAYRSVEFFADAVANSVKNDFDYDKINVITFVPQTKKETEEKGINQSESLALETGKLLNLPVEALLIKLFETKRQHDMPWYTKSGNVFGAFGCPDDSKVKGKTVLLVDDIKTSGKTINECAKVLHLNGAAEVYCAVIGVT